RRQVKGVLLFIHPGSSTLSNHKKRQPRTQKSKFDAKDTEFHGCETPPEQRFRDDGLISGPFRSSNSRANSRLSAGNTRGRLSPTHPLMMRPPIPWRIKGLFIVHVGNTCKH
ncbi:unnamed protein product, partial [Ectocarpus sp. 12 AP-2014]